MGVGALAQSRVFRLTENEMTAEKRITIKVASNIDVIRDRLAKDTGIRMSYIQIINYLIHFYMKHAAEPRTQWRSGVTK